MVMGDEITLLPMPRRVTRRDGAFVVRGNEGVSARIDAGLRPQGYRLQITPDRVNITGADPAGVFYGRQTLAQFIRQFGGVIPAMEIEDWPDFVARGVMLDISRDKVPTMATLFSLVGLLAELKINQLQLYTEHTFAYASHREVWADASPMTGQEIRELDRYCAERFIELAPNQNSFGHMARWLKWPRYEPLAECQEGFTFPWGYRHEGGFSLNPLDPRSLELMEGLFDELLPNFSSKQFNVGCDETFDLGLGKSKAECERRGKERVYLEFVLKIYEAVKKRGRTMQFWGDIILHKPELIAELPKDVIALNWGYEADHPFEKETAAFRDAGVPFYVCPGTSSWCSISGRTDNAIVNLKSAAACGLANGATGYLNTDWGDVGHLQYLPVSHLGFAAGAAYSWCMAANRDLPIAKALDVHVFRDGAGVMGRLMVDFGNVYQAAKPLANGTRVFWSFTGGEQRKKLYESLTKGDYDATEMAVANSIEGLESVRMERSDSALIADEIKNAAAMLRHGCRRGRWRIGAESLSTGELIADVRKIRVEHERLWLARNRPGGLRDSSQRLGEIIDSYQSGRGE